jgi:fibronectin-binding autotransporter adhesin
VTLGSLSGVLYGNSGAVASVATSSVTNGTGISLSGTAALVGAGGLTITNTGVLSVQQTFGTTQAGAITLATSTATTFQGLTIANAITNSGGTFTIAPDTISGTLNVGGGGTGLSSVSDGRLVIGGTSATALTSLATSSGGTILQTSFTTGRPSWVATSTLGINLGDTTGTLTVARGGTGQTTFTSSQLLYGTGAGALASVATTTLSGNSQIALSQPISVIGGSASALSIVADSIGDTQLAFNTGQNLTTASSPTFAALTLTAPLTVSSGGTGWASVSSGSILYGNGSGSLSTTTAGTAGQVLALLNGIPTWTATTTAGTGLTYTSGSFNVNTTQNIAKLSNLTTNGFVKTSGGDGTLSIDTSTYLTSALTSIGPAGQLQTGPAVTLATSSTAFNGLTASTTITGAGNTLTFTNTLAGTLGVGGGGTGATTLTGLLQGNGSSAVTAITGTIGQFPYYNGTNTLLATSSLFLAANQNVGIGTTSPYAKLSVVGQTVAAYFTATTTTASTFPYASTTALTVSGGANALTIGALSGILKATSGAVGSGHRRHRLRSRH